MDVWPCLITGARVYRRNDKPCRPISYLRSTYNRRNIERFYCANQKSRYLEVKCSKFRLDWFKIYIIYQVCNCTNFDSISNWKQWDPAGNCGYHNWHNQLFNAIRILYYARSYGTLQVLLLCRVFVDRQLCCSTQPRLGCPHNDPFPFRGIVVYPVVCCLKKTRPRLFKIVFKIILLSRPLSSFNSFLFIALRNGNFFLETGISWEGKIFLESLVA